MKNVIYIVVAVIFILGYLRYFEYRSLYFPMDDIEYVPSDIAMSYEETYLDTADGVRLNAWLIPGKDSIYTILFCHGNGGNISHRLEKIAFLNSLGIDVFIFDYRGYGKSHGRPSERGLYRDAEAAYDYLVSEKKLSPRRIILYGESLGGAVAADLAAKRSARALILESTFTSTHDMARSLYPFFPSFFLSSRFDALQKIKNIDIPKLIIHSKGDEIVPFSHSVKLFKSAPEPKKHIKLRGSHNTSYQDSKDLYISGIGEFLQNL